MTRFVMAAYFAARADRSAPGRAVFLLATLTVAVAAWVVLSAMASPFVHSGKTGLKFGGIVVTNATGHGNLPKRYIERISTMPGVRFLTYTDVALVKCKDGAPPVSIDALGGPGASVNLFGLDPNAQQQGQLERWRNDPLAIVVGSDVAKGCGWSVGITVSPVDMFRHEPVELHVVGVKPPQKNPMANQIAYGHYDYVNRLPSSSAGPGRITAISVIATSRGVTNALASRIEDAFAFEDPPVRAMTVSEFQNALDRFGKVQYVLAFVMLAAFICAALVLISALAHAAVQRGQHMALMQALGFRRAALLSGFVLENLLIVALGAGIGIVAGLFLLHAMPASMAQLFGQFAVPRWSWWLLPIWLALLLASGLITPTLCVARCRATGVREA
ncbi:MAG TPA: ABC transporter permease [Gammaproteobacteria bacterium]|nr:ABC transporter permease [Gammaproteobacteria bacterium]